MPEGFHFQNGQGSWKLEILPTGGRVMTLAFPGGSLAVCTDATLRVKVLVQTPELPEGQFWGLGLAEMETKWNSITKDFVQSLTKAQPGSVVAFQRMMVGMGTALEAEPAGAGSLLRGDRARAMVILDHWHRTEGPLGLGDLESLLAFMDAYGREMKDAPESLDAPALGGLFRPSAIQLDPALAGADGRPLLSLSSILRRLDWACDPDAPDAAAPPSAGPSQAAKSMAPGSGTPSDGTTPSPGTAPEYASPAPGAPGGAGDQTPLRGRPLRLEDLMDTAELERGGAAERKDEGKATRQTMVPLFTLSEWNAPSDSLGLSTQEPGAGAPVEGEPWRNEWEKAVRTLAHLSSFGGLEGVGRLEDTGGSLASTHLTGTPPQGETKEH